MVFWAKKGRIAANWQQKTVQPPKRGSPDQALIELVRWFRLDEGINELAKLSPELREFAIERTQVQMT